MTLTKPSMNLQENFQEYVKDSPRQALTFNVNVNINIRVVFLGGKKKSEQQDAICNI